MKKTVFLGWLIIILAFSAISCGDDSNDTITNNDFIVTFDLDGGNIEGVMTVVKISVRSGEKITNLPNPNKAGNTFDGWFTAINGSGTQFFSSTSVISNLTVYAKWIEKSDNTDNSFIGKWTGIIDAGPFMGLKFEIIFEETEWCYIINKDPIIGQKGIYNFDGDEANLTTVSYTEDGITWLTELSELESIYFKVIITGNTMDFDTLILIKQE